MLVLRRALIRVIGYHTARTTCKHVLIWLKTATCLTNYWLQVCFKYNCMLNFCCYLAFFGKDNYVNHENQIMAKYYDQEISK